MAPLTDEEHEARAMLLGAKWKPWLHCYVWEKPIRDNSSSERWIDDETLEELDAGQKWQRLNKSINNGSW